LKTSAHGLCDSEVYVRRKLFGKNCIKEKEKSLRVIFFRQLNSPLIFILFAAAFISLFLSEITDFIVVVGIIAVNTIIGFWQEVKAEFSLEALKKMTETKNIVLRDGKMKLIPSSEIVPGDCIIFHQGEVVTADVRIIESSSLMVDESTITGESVPVLKQHGKILPEDTFPFEWTNMLLSGSTIVRGKGSGIVVRTGNSTYLASIGEKAQEAAPSTPLQIALKSFSKRYVLLILGILGLVAIVGFFQGRSFLDLLYILLSSLVSAVPEGLPIIVTLVMVFGAHFLRKRDTLVRDLPSVETLGSATVIATDKTGTITEGRLLVKEAYYIDSEILKRIGALCNDEKEGLGDPIDVALSDWIGNVQDIRLQYPQKWNYPFDSDLMLMATAHTVNGVDTLYVKGAYEVLREKAKDQVDLENFDAKFNTFLEKGYRVLAFGESVFISQDPSKWELKIVGIIGFLDPPKKGVRHAVAAAKKAGIHVIMVTGDHPLTAQTIAHEVGIWKKQDRVLIGKEIEKMTEKELLAALGPTTVLARILPEHKYRVVKALQLKGEIVAVTGDGVNDIPALKASNIGIAMGNGTEAAKSVSQMVLVDNNFTIIVDAIKNARVIAANIRKAIYYLISTSLQELSVLCLSVFTSMPIPLTAIQILWINLVTDGVMDKTFPFYQRGGGCYEAIS
jgi:Ca2+-transporting ATPase